MSKEKHTREILLAVVPALEIANSIFNSETYKNEEESSHPKMKILLSATCKLQQELRKGLFNYVFSNEEAEQAVLEFFNYKR